MKTLAIRIEYDGTAYNGWQIQVDAPTIQETLNKTLSHMISGKIMFTGAGRTDTGVHARGQVAHAYIDDRFPIPEEKIIRAMNSNLPRDIRLTGARIIVGKFHARYDAVAREYSYNITKKESVFGRNFTTYLRYEPDFGLLCDAAAVFLGQHDFTTFSKDNPSTKSYICDVRICEWKKDNEHTFRLKIKADRFVYGMVRSLTGAMLDAARGKRTIDDLRDSLKHKDRSLNSPLAPAKGLILEEIFYGDNLNIF